MPDDIDALRSALVAERVALATEQVARREAEARASGAEAMVAHLKLLIAKLRHEQFGASSERGRKLLDQLELQLEELEAAAVEDDVAANSAAEDATERSATPRRPVRGPLPAHLPRERVVIPGPTECPCCQGRLVKLGESVTETLELVPRRWKVVQTVREKLACRACASITQPPAPFHSIARGRAGPELLATILEAKFAQHLPLNRQSETFAREGIALDVSTLADWVGACTATLAPLTTLIQAHVMAAARLHGDDTTVPVMAKGRTITGRLWTYVRDDKPFGGHAPPAALFHYSPDRTAAHPGRHLAGYAGILQADAYAGFAAGAGAPTPRGGTRPARAGQVRSSRRDAGRMGAASCSSWPRWQRRRLRPRRCAASMRSSMSNAPSTACRRISASRCARHRSRRWSATSRPGCVACGARCRDTPRWPRRWTTCSSAGRRSAGFSVMAGSA